LVIKRDVKIKNHLPFPNTTPSLKSNPITCFKDIFLHKKIPEIFFSIADFSQKQILSQLIRHKLRIKNSPFFLVLTPGSQTQETKWKLKLQPSMTLLNKIVYL